MVRIFSLVLLAIPTSIYAGELTPWKAFNEMSCKVEFQKVAVSEGFEQSSFRESLADKFTQKFYRNISDQVGSSVELHFEAKKSPVVLKIHDQQIDKISFDKNCVVAKTQEPLPWYLEKYFNKKDQQKKFDDGALKTLVSSGKPAIIYSWSPKFAYSVYDLPRVKKIAEKLGYQFVAVVDPRVNEKEARDALKKSAPKIPMMRQLASQKELMPNISYELYFSGGFNHFPFTYIVNHGKIHPRYIIGVMKDEGYESMMKTFMQEL
jgi:RNase H-fold protein (predicted Holliday junction resolvase)